MHREKRNQFLLEKNLKLKNFLKDKRITLTKYIELIEKGIINLGAI